ncbi:hypothetical protein PRIPAC_80484, partial [Pristionchus pacificus]
PSQSPSSHHRKVVLALSAVITLLTPLFSSLHYHIVLASRFVLGFIDVSNISIIHCLDHSIEFVPAFNQLPRCCFVFCGGERLLMSPFTLLDISSLVDSPFSSRLACANQRCWEDGHIFSTHLELPVLCFS